MSQHAQAWLLGGGIAVAFIVMCVILAWRAHWEPGHYSRTPADVSPFMAAILTGRRESSYRPTGITARTASGITVEVGCPHLTGHRSPDLAVKCGEREKERIERRGW